MPDMLEIIHRNMILGMVQREIFCPRSGKVLDIRTVKVLRDSDGDPMAVLSPEGFDSLLEDSTTVDFLKSKGIQFPE